MDKAVSTLSKHQTFVIERVLRSSIIPHPKNPRTIRDGAKKKLRDKMKEVGLLQPIIVNRTTGYLIGGHQRLEAMDSLERYKPGGKDYMLDVSVVELDEKRELEAIVFLNNTSAMGDWNLDTLAEIGAAPGSLFSMGFDRADVEVLFGGDSRFEMAFTDAAQTSESKDALFTMREEGKAAAKERPTKESSLEAIKQHRADYAERAKEDESVDYYVTVVCQDKAEKERLMAHLGVPKGEIYISPAEILCLKR